MACFIAACLEMDGNLEFPGHPRSFMVVSFSGESSPRMDVECEEDPHRVVVDREFRCPVNTGVKSPIGQGDSDFE